MHDIISDFSQQLVELVAFFSTSSQIDLVVSSKFSRLRDVESVFKTMSLSYNEKWNFWLDKRGSQLFPCLAKVTESDTEVVFSVFFR